MKTEDEERAHCEAVAKDVFGDGWTDRTPSWLEVCNLVMEERAAARSEALDQVLATVESYAGGCDNYVAATAFEERDAWRARAGAARALAGRVGSMKAVTR